MHDTVAAVSLTTTDPDPDRGEVLDVAAAVMTAGRITACFAELVRPPSDLPPGVSALTGITPAMLANARPPRAVLDDLLNFLPTDAMLVSHQPAQVHALLKAAFAVRAPSAPLDLIGLSKVCFPLLLIHTLEARSDR